MSIIGPVGSSASSAPTSTSAANAWVAGSPGYNQATQIGELPQLLAGMLTPSDKALLTKVFGAHCNPDGTVTATGNAAYTDMFSVASAIAMERSATQSKAPLTASMILNMAKLAASSAYPLSQGDIANALGYVNGMQ